ncbi:hypothetical protein BaRGS_00038683 [Batillaria attramentaria]|uniref:Methyltransferase type 11 domain-containing protein n=1 Tax=Batillaria attramentaria TaxID=370345 RepID=A0ABD0J5C6_9CAEN
MASLSGGWCLPYAQKSAHVCDEPLARAISELLKGKAVAGFGDGPGMYKEIHDRRRLMASYHAYDGSPYIENVTNNMVKFMDLTIPQYGLPLYDWVVCLEVAEHIPHKYQDVFLDNIARHARSGIIMSWAPPGQGGLNHINEQSREEVQRIMKNIDFALDLNSTKVLRDASSVNWLKRNVKVYRRISGVDPDENEA